MINADIKSLSKKELTEKLQEERTLYKKMKFSHAVTPLENPLKLKSSRRLIARFLTELNSRSEE